ncbi:MAG: rod shape-determining protein MreC [Ignavibacteriae bacterium]|nr:MAG: rod shape-determining protein MreC [Ignavibacteriota bacterium]
MLQRFYDILYEFREYVIFSAFMVVSIVLMAFNDNPQIKQIRTVSTVIFGGLQEQLSFIPTYFGLKAENELLHHINIELADEAQRLREAKLENLRLRQLLGLKSEPPSPLIAAHIVNKNLTLLRNTITLNVGSDDSVHQFMPVVSDGGLVGIVTGVTRHYSVVNILLNTEFRASGKIQRSRVDGIVMWDGKVLGLKNVPKMRDVKVGDVVSTSEYSNSFPPDIRIGLVSEVREQPSSLFKIVTIEPGVDFVKLETVFVMTSSQEKERAELEQRIVPRIGK